MKTLITAIALAISLTTVAAAQPYYYPSYECAPSQYDSSGAPVPQYCGH